MPEEKELPPGLARMKQVTTPRRFELLEWVYELSRELGYGVMLHGMMQQIAVMHPSWSYFQVLGQAQKRWLENFPIFAPELLVMLLNDRTRPLRESDFKFLQDTDLVSHGKLLEILKSANEARLTICPLCRGAEFNHDDLCRLRIDEVVR